jgi:hypothetical protein
MLPVKREGMAVYTHSLPAVLIGGAVAAGFLAATRRPGARVVFLAWLLHWLADLVTGRKPVILAEPLIGLDLYKLPAVDFGIESVAVIAGCVIYARGFEARAELRRVVVILCAALIALQAAVDVALSLMRNSEWSPSLAVAGWQPHLRTFRSHDESASRMHLALRPSYQQREVSDGDGRSQGHRDPGLPHLRQGKVLHTGSPGSRQL